MQSSVVYHYNPTSNRNRIKSDDDFIKLYIIIILHQTATMGLTVMMTHRCISL